MNIKDWKTFYLNSNYKTKAFGFTLAEVLITLGIIGAIAAMTIPSLLNQTNEKEFLTGFQKTYSELSQAYVTASQENGTADNWSTAEDAYNYVKPYLNIQKDCGYSTPCTTKAVYKDLSGDTNAGHGGGKQTYHLILSNGALIYFRLDVSQMIYVDINGEKPPNQWGYDYFCLQFTVKNNGVFLTWPRYGYSMVENSSTFCSRSYTGTAWERGRACSYWVIRHGNMDYLHRDIPDAEWVK